MIRYFRLFAAFARFGLANEMAFRTNFLVKLLVEVLWLGILLVFYWKLFENTTHIAGWDRGEYFFFVGCGYALAGIVETFFLSNCTEFAELVRSGDLDMYLLRPIDEQFLISCRWIDWSTLPNVVQGAVIMIIALAVKDWHFDPLRLTLFLVLFVCGCALAYSFLLMLSCTAVWLVRNQNLMEMWWLFTTLMRYPRAIYDGPKVWPFGLFFTFVVPVLVVVNVPAETMVKAFDLRFIAWTIGSALAMLVISRRFFRRALQSYRSASS
ncbi:MAG TPA: ABC-2 family transporter protein [Gemmataceae bacterium]|jgi:ABC-2 type transport system permease protein